MYCHLLDCIATHQSWCEGEVTVTYHYLHRVLLNSNESDGMKVILSHFIVSTLSSTDILGEVIQVSISVSGMGWTMNRCCRSVLSGSSRDSTEGRNKDSLPLCVVQKNGPPGLF